LASRAELVAIALGDIQSRRDFNLDATLRRWEEAYIEAAQQLAHDNMSQAARLLGVNRTTLYNRIDMLERVKAHQTARSDRTEPTMYLEHFGLNEPPFRITPHTDFFFEGPIAAQRSTPSSMPSPTTKASSRSAARSAAARPCSAGC
jgi:hypothetical protein